MKTEMCMLTKIQDMYAQTPKADAKMYLPNLDASILGGATNEF